MPPTRGGSKSRALGVGVELSGKLRKDELLKRLKSLAVRLSDSDQEEKLQSEDLDFCNDTSRYLVTPFVLEHKDKDVLLYAALCLSEILRIFAPTPPYSKNQLLQVFSLMVKQLRGIAKPKSAQYKCSFHLLENLALVKSFSICVSLEFQDLIADLFRVLFDVINKEHSAKVHRCMLEIMGSLVAEGEFVPEEVLEIILQQIKPSQEQNSVASDLARELIKKTSENIRPAVQLFFHSALTSDSEISEDICDLILELNRVSSSVLLAVYPQLEYKIKSTNVQDRIKVTKLLAVMFADENSNLAEQYKALWTCYLGRYVDISLEVRLGLVKQAKDLLSGNSDVSKQIQEKLHGRSLDPDEKVRQAMVSVVCDAALNNIDNISDQVASFFVRFLEWQKRKRKAFGRYSKKDERCEGECKKRSSDRTGKHVQEIHTRIKFCKCLFKSSPSQCLTVPLPSSSANPAVAERLSWIPSSLLHCFYQETMEDRLRVQRLLNECLVPVSLHTEDRMTKLLTLYSELDSLALTAFHGILDYQSTLRELFKDLLNHRCNEEKKKQDDESLKKLIPLIAPLARTLPEPFRAQENLKKLYSMLAVPRLRNHFLTIVSSNVGCSKAFQASKDIMIEVGRNNPIAETVEALVIQVAPLLVDSDAIGELLKLIRDSLEIEEDEDLDSELQDQVLISQLQAKKGLELLVELARVCPSYFQTSDSYEQLLVFLRNKDSEIVDAAVKILAHVGGEPDSSLLSCFQTVLSTFITRGTPVQAKFALRTLKKMFTDKTSLFERIFTKLVNSLKCGEPTLCTVLSSLGEMALQFPSLFETKYIAVVREFVVKELLMKDLVTPSESESEEESEWCDEKDVSQDTKLKMCGIKLLVKWLRGMEAIDNTSVPAYPVLNLLETLIRHQGDLQAKGLVRKQDRSRLRLAAACAVLKIAQGSDYHTQITAKYFNTLALTMQDVCFEVREEFTRKLQKAQESLQLPLQYLGIYALAASEPDQERRAQVKQMLQKNVLKRRDMMKASSKAAARYKYFLPEYALPNVIHLLAHHPDFDPADINSLDQTAEYLWFFMEPIMAKAENYGLLKKLIEIAKQSKDALAPEDEQVNQKLFTVCDLADGVLTRKTQLFTHDLAGYKPGVSTLCFITGKKGETNTKNYLPVGYEFSSIRGRKPRTAPKATTSSKPTVAKRNTKGKLSSPRKRTATSTNMKETPLKKPRLSISKKEETERNLGSSESTSSSQRSGISTKKSLQDSNKKSPKKTLKEKPKQTATRRSLSPLKTPTKRSLSPQKTPTKRSLSPLKISTKKSPIKKVGSPGKTATNLRKGKASLTRVKETPSKKNRLSSPVEEKEERKKDRASSERTSSLRRTVSPTKRSLQDTNKKSPRTTLLEKPTQTFTRRSLSPQKTPTKKSPFKIAESPGKTATNMRKDKTKSVANGTVGKETKRGSPTKQSKEEKSWTSTDSESPSKKLKARPALNIKRKRTKRR